MKQMGPNSELPCSFQYLLCVRSYNKRFMYFISFNPHNSPLRLQYYYLHFTEKTEIKLSKLPKFAQLLNGRDGIQIQTTELQVFNYCIILMLQLPARKHSCPSVRQGLGAKCRFTTTLVSVSLKMPQSVGSRKIQLKMASAVLAGKGGGLRQRGLWVGWSEAQWPQQ